MRTVTLQDISALCECGFISIQIILRWHMVHSATYDRFPFTQASHFINKIIAQKCILSFQVLFSHVWDEENEIEYSGTRLIRHAKVSVLSGCPYKAGCHKKKMLQLQGMTAAKLKKTRK